MHAPLLPVARVPRIALGEVAALWKRALQAALRHQALSEGAPDDGALVPPDWGAADPSHAGTAALLMGLASWGLLAGRTGAGAPLPAPELRNRALRAARFLLRVQRPGGRIDLRSCNPDSAPDTAFVVQQLCAVLDLADAAPPAAREGLAPVLEEMERFVRRAVPGVAAGGFHTPNHRWVVCSALAQAARRCPDLDVRETLGRYLAEGIDIDAEGMFLERSAGIYDAVCDRSLLFLGEALGHAGAREAALANLEADLRLLNPDGSIETGLSHRQDTAQVIVPLGLAACYLQAAAVRPDPRFAAAAAFLWDRAAAPGLGDLNWLACSLARWGGLQPEEAVHAAPARSAFPRNGLWRAAGEGYALSVFQGRTHLASLTGAGARIESIRIAQAYMGVGRFRADAVEETARGFLLTSRGEENPRRPGYELPLGEPVPPDRWDEALAGRPLRRLAAPRSELAIEEAEGGVTLRYRTRAGEPGVMAQLTLDFPPGGIWEAGGASFHPRKGQVLFLQGGGGAMRYGRERIEIGPGAAAHEVVALRDSEAAPDSVRVVVPFLTPVDHALAIRFRTA